MDVNCCFFHHYVFYRRKKYLNNEEIVIVLGTIPLIKNEKKVFFSPLGDSKANLYRTWIDLHTDHFNRFNTNIESANNVDVFKTNDLLKFKPSTRKECWFKCLCLTEYFRNCHFQTQIYLGLTENGSQEKTKEKTSSKQQFCGQKMPSWCQKSVTTIWCYLANMD